MLRHAEALRSGRTWLNPCFLDLGWVDSRDCLDEMWSKLLTLTGLKPQSIGRPASSQWLHRLRYQDYKLQLLPPGLRYCSSRGLHIRKNMWRSGQST